VNVERNKQTKGKIGYKARSREGQSHDLITEKAKHGGYTKREIKREYFIA
jgi:hypothetical protein